MTDNKKDALVPTEQRKRPCDGDFTYEAPERLPYPSCIAGVRRNLFKGFVFVVFAGTFGLVCLKYVAEKDEDNFREHFIELCKLLSVPLVSLLFTWFHVWLALTMMFYPIKFVGFPSRPIVLKCVDLPINGWQGIVPRKVKEMAERSCETMIGNVVTLEEFIERIDPEQFFEELRDIMAEMSASTLNAIMTNHFPQVWPSLPEGVKEELRRKVFAETKESFRPALVELRENIAPILDIKQMAVDAFIEDPNMMVEMFRSVAMRELQFIQHVAAVMGFALGLVQVVLYLLLSDAGPYVDYIMLPVSGLIIGYGTNLLALTMTFRPIWPHMFWGNKINIQGVFLKRQKEASYAMASSICGKVVQAKAMLGYMFKGVGEGESSPGLDRVLEIFQKHVDQLIDRGVLVSNIFMPTAVGNKLTIMKREVVDIAITQLPQHSDKVEAFLNRVMRVEETLASRLSRLTPPEFEAIIHPIFSEDEWILLLVGAILGVLIGVLQAWALQAIH